MENDVMAINQTRRRILDLSSHFLNRRSEYFMLGYPASGERFIAMSPLSGESALHTFENRVLKGNNMLSSKPDADKPLDDEDIYGDLEGHRTEVQNPCSPQYRNRAEADRRPSSGNILFEIADCIKRGDVEVNKKPHPLEISRI
jgi:hypothetical protein